jgi:nitrile hydratase accessory protein
MTRVDVPALATLPRDDAGQVFAAPWQAQAFALAVSLHEKGLFSWSEWAERFSAALKTAPAACGADEVNETYWRTWLSTLETIVTETSPITPDALSARADAWDAAARATPHGQPIRLS